MFQIRFAVLLVRKPLPINATNNKIYSANYWDNTVAIIDGATNSVITTVTVGDGPCAFTYNPQQNRVYVANRGSSSVSVIKDVTGIEECSILNAERLLPEIYPNPAKTVIRVRGPIKRLKSLIFLES